LISTLTNLLNELGIHQLYLFFALSWGILQVFLMPPFMFPDEEGHFLRSWGVADLQLVQPELRLILPENVLKLVDEINHAQIKEKKIGFGRIKPYFKDDIGSITKESYVHFCAYNWLGYIPQAVGITLVKIFHGSPLHALYSGRLLNLLTGVLLIYLAIKSLPFGREIFLIVALLPMTMHQMSSLSNDALTIAGLLFFLLKYFIFIRKIELQIVVLFI
jgi:uncharacterized membrane protein